MAACSIANVPVVEVAHPAIHLSNGDFLGFVNHARQDSGVVHFGVPQFDRQIVISADAARQYVQFGLRNTVDILCNDSEASHAFDVPLFPEFAELGEDALASPVLAQWTRTF